MQGGTPHGAVLGVEAFFCAGGRTLFLATYLGTWEVQNFLGSKVNFLGFLGIFLSNGRYFLGSLRRARLRMSCLRRRDPRDVLSNVKERLFSIDGTLAQNAAQFDLIR